jgi:hypothetical protein
VTSGSSVTPISSIIGSISERELSKKRWKLCGSAASSSASLLRSI